MEKFSFNPLKSGHQLNSPELVKEYAKNIKVSIPLNRVIS